MFFMSLGNASAERFSFFQQQFLKISTNLATQLEEDSVVNKYVEKLKKQEAESNAACSVIIRAKGSCGGEIMELELDGVVVSTYTLTTSFANYSYNGFEDGQVVHINFTNDQDNGCDYNFTLDYVRVNGINYEVETEATRIEGCGSDVSLWCSGTFSFGTLYCDGTTGPFGECACSDNILGNGSYEYNNGQYTFPLSIDGNPADTLSNNGHYNSIYEWNPGLTGPYMFYIQDLVDRVNNPEGDYFVWLPSTDDCLVGNTNFGTELELEDGAEYQICFYAAAWNVSLDANSLPDGGNVSQTTGNIKLEFDYTSSGFTVIRDWDLPASNSWTNLNWQKFSYNFVFDATDYPSTFLFTNGTTQGVALDAITISKVECPVNELCIVDGADTDGDGALPCDDPDCNGVGAAQAITANIGTINAPNALYSPDGQYAKIHDIGDRLTLDLGAVLPAGTPYQIVWRRKSSYTAAVTSDMIVEESSDNVNFTQNSVQPSTLIKTESVYTNMTTGVATRYIRLREATADNDDFDLDAITFDLDCEASSLCYAIAQGPNGQLFRWSPLNNQIVHTGQLGATEIETMALSYTGDTIYAVDADRLGIVDKFTGEFYPYTNDIGTANGSDGAHNINDIDALAMDDETGLFWAVERRAGAGTTDLLLKIHPQTGTVFRNTFGAGQDYIEITGALADIDDISFNPLTNELFAISTVSGGTDNDKVVIIDTETGATSIVATLQTCDIEGLTFNDKGDLYGTTGNDNCETSNDRSALWSIDVDTPVATKIGTFKPTGYDVEACACLVSALPPPPTSFYEGWQFGCDAGTCVEIDGMGIKGSLPATLNVDQTDLTMVVLEATYNGGSGAPEQIEFESSNGDKEIVSKILYDNGQGDRYFRTTMAPADWYKINTTTGANQAETFVIYTFRKCEKYASFGAFTHKRLHQESYDFGFNIPIAARARDIDITVPLSEITNDGRIAIIKATAGSVTKTLYIDDYNKGNSLNITPFTLEDVPGSVDSITITVESPVGGQSLYLSGAGSATVHCLPDLQIETTASLECAQPGEEVIYTYKVYNNGIEDITNISVTDSKLGNINMGATVLSPGDSLITTKNYIVQESDLPGPIVNVATISGVDSYSGGTKTDEDTVNVNLMSIDFEKSATPRTAKTGETVTYSYEITNNGSEDIWATINDDKLGAIDQTEERVTDALQLLYTFSEGSGNTITDVSGVGAPINLTIQDPANTNWGGTNLSVNSATRASSGGNNTKVLNACQSSNELTVEAWVKPANNAQGGPARILTFSQDGTNRNFQLMQEGNDYRFRLKTTGNTSNELRTNGTIIQGNTSLQHVVYTYDGTTARFYIDGAEVPTSGEMNPTGNFSTWGSNYSIGMFNEFGADPITDRDWLGEIELAAVYSKALSAAEITQNYNTGFNVSSVLVAAGTSETVTFDHVIDGNDLPSPLINEAIVEVISLGGCTTTASDTAKVNTCLGDMDFTLDGNGNPLSAGDILFDAYANWGVQITVNDPTNHPPMVFNSSAPSGGDVDLGTPHQDFGGPGHGDGGKSGRVGQNDQARGNAAIFSEDYNINNPDDNGAGGTMTFTYATPTDVSYLEIVDMDYGEVDGRIRLYNAANTMIKEQAIVAYGDNSYQVVVLETSDVSKMEIYMPSSGSITAIYYCDAAPAHASVGDLVWFDNDGNGTINGSETGIPNVTLQLTDANGNLYAEVTTDENGLYLFPDLMPGDYRVQVVANTLPAFMQQTFELDNDLNNNSGTFTLGTTDRLDVDFGYRLDCSIDVGDLTSNDPFVCLAPAGDGVIAGTPDGNAVVPAGFKTLYLLTEGANKTIQQTANNPSFNVTTAGDYYIHTLIYQDTSGEPHYLDLSFINFGTTPLSQLKNLLLQGGGDICAGLDEAGAATTVDPCDAQLGDLVWEDTNANGLKDASESGMGSVTVQLSGLAPDGEVITKTTTTNASGIYGFINLPPGTYEVTFVKPNDYISTYPNEGNDTLDSDADPITGKVSNISLATSENNSTIDAGFYQYAAIGNYVFEDTNGNGQQNGDDSGLSGVTVSITGNTGNGTPFSASMPTTGTGFYEFTDLVPGTYTLTFGEVSGFDRTSQDIGTDDEKDSDADPDSGETGAYTLVSGETNHSVDAGYINTGDTQLGDFVFEDLNANGIQDTGEPGIPDVQIRLDGVNGLNLPIDTRFTTTDANGLYLFDGLVPGVYTVTFTTPTGFTPTYQNEGGEDANDSDPNPLTQQVLGIVLQSGDIDKTIDAGFYKVGTLGDYVWEDSNGNGLQENNEPAIEGVSISLSGQTGNGTNVSATTTTDANGYYQFPDLVPGTYNVTFDTPTGFTATYTDQGSDDTIDNDISATDNEIEDIEILSGGSNQTMDAGYYKTGNYLGDYVWEDLNANGIQESGEPAIEGIQVNLIGVTGNNTPISLTQYTDANGLYKFDNLIPGTYALNFILPATFTPTYSNEQTDDTVDSDIDAAGRIENITVTSGTQNPTLDAGVYNLNNSIGDYVWEDTNGNGLQDGGESGIEGIVVTLMGTTGNGTPVTETYTTTATGFYEFTDIIPGTYKLVFSGPTGYEVTTANAGDDTKDSDVDPNTQEITGIEIISNTVDNDYDAGYLQTSRLGDYVWEDVNGNGIQDAGEPGIQGVTVTLTGTTGDGQTIDIDVVTDANGYYEFTGLLPGDYEITFTAPTGFSATYPNEGTDDRYDSDADPVTGKITNIVVTSGSSDLTLDAGFYNTNNRLGDYVWEDMNGNGVQDTGEPAIQGVNVSISGTTGNGTNFTDNTTTDANGYYQFTNLIPGTYEITFGTPTGFTATYANQGDDTKDSDANQNDGKVSNIEVISGTNNQTIDAGFYKLGNSIGDYVWEDTNGNGIQDNGEPAVSGVQVTLAGVTGNNSVAGDVTTTDANGFYEFTNLIPGTYTVTFNEPANYQITSDNKGTDDTKDSDADSDGRVIGIIVESGTQNPTIDAGILQGATIGNFVWEDVNGDGIQDEGEAGIDGVLVTLSGFTGDGTEINLTTTTTNGGLYEFTGLIPGTYSVSFGTPDGFTSTYPNEGDDALDSDAIGGIVTDIVLTSGEENLTIDAGFYQLGNTIGDYVWEDMNANGIQENGEPAIAGVSVTLNGTTGNGTDITPITITTDANGYYEFTDLIPGTYSVSFGTPNNFAPTYPNEGTDDTLDSDPVNGVVTDIEILSGTDNPTIDAGYYALGSQIGDFVWEDLDGDGIQDPGEPGIPDVTVTLTGTTGNGTPVEITVTTDENGNYIFDDVIPGTYTITFDTPDGFTGTYPNEGTDDANDSDAIGGVVTGVVINSGDTDLTIDAGFYQLGNSIGDYVWQDDNGDGIQDTGEPAIAGVGVSLNGFTGNGTEVNMSIITDANGFYEFTDLIPGTYKVTFATPTGFIATYPNEGTDDEKDSDAINGEVVDIEVQSGTQNPTIDAGFIAANAKIGDFVWEDIDGDGIQDEGESGIAGVTVTLTGTTGNGTPIQVTTTTNPDGSYLFESLIPGTYTVTFGTPDGFTGTYPNEGTDDENDSDAIGGVVTGIVINSGTEDLSIDAGFYQLGNTIGDYVWEDMNANGIQENGEPAIEGVSITLNGTTGNGTDITPITITTDANGYYEFTDLIPGTYSVTFGTPNNFAATYPNEGTDDTLDSDPVNGIVTDIEILSGTNNPTIDAGYYALGSQIGDFVWEDLDGDGIQDPGEPGISGVTVTLTGTTGNGTPVEITVTTDENGNYIFDDVISGTYTITFGTPDGFTGTYPNEGTDDANDSDAIGGVVTGIVINSGDTDLTIDAGFYQLGNSIGDYVWQDDNGDGIQDAGEPAIGGVGVSLNGFTGNGTEVNMSIITDANGFYEFTDLIPGTYKVTFATPTGFIATYPNEGTDDTKDSDAINGEVVDIEVQSGTQNPTIDAGFIAANAKIGDFVWEDIDGDGIQDPDEPGIAGVEVTLTGTTGNGTPIQVTTITNPDGSYLFESLIPGTYTVIFGTPDGFTGTYPNEGTDDENDSDAIGGVVTGIVINSGTEDLSIDAGFYQLGNTIGDYVWEDMNANGIQENGEPAIEGVSITLNGTTGNGTDITPITITTDANGYYEFTDLIPGTYSVTFGTPNNFAATYPNEGTDDTLDSNPVNGVVTDIEILSGTNNPTIDAGYYALGSQIGDFVWEDLDGDGIQDPGEPGIPGVTVTLTGTTGNGTPVEVTVTTDENGNYIFDDVIPGTYTITFGTPDGFTGTYPNEGTDDANDSDAIGGVVTGIVINSGDTDLTIDAGFYQLGNSIGDYVWQDDNGDGIQDAGEPAIGGVGVSLNGFTGNGTEVNMSIITDANGFYEFTDLIPGTYKVTFATPTGFIATYPNEGTDDTKDSDAINGEVVDIEVQSGTQNPTIDAGFIAANAKIGDFVWEDIDGDGIQDPDEPGIAGVTVTLTGTTGNGTAVEVTVTTDANGNYLFENILPGTYSVTFGTPTGFTGTYPNEGDYDSEDSDAINGVVTGIVISSGTEDLTIDAGFYQLGNTIGDYVWEDTNANGIQDESNTGIANVEVKLTGTTGNGTAVTATVNTDANGYYDFTDLVPGNYNVEFVTPTDFVATYTDEGTDDTIDSDPINGFVNNINVLSGTVNETIDAGFISANAKIGDFVWEDLDGDGIQDPDEPGIQGVAVTLTGTTGNGTAVELTVYTDENGNYLFENIFPGTYTVTFGTPGGFSATYPNEGTDDANDSDAIGGQVTGIVINSGTENLTIDAGFYQTDNRIGDYTWEDVNGNGAQDATEPVVSNVLVTLNGFTGNGTPVTMTMNTDANGWYEFTNLIPGTYSITFGEPSGFMFTHANQGTTTDDKDSDPDQNTGTVQNIVVQSGTQNFTIDAGYVKTNTGLGDYVWEDVNGDGIQDTNEPPIQGHLVTLTGTDNAGNPVNLTTNTDANGFYEFVGLFPGTYIVNFDLPGTIIPTFQDLGGDDALDSDANPTTGAADPVDLLSGTYIETIDAGFYSPVSIGDYVWLDEDQEGDQDEPKATAGINNVLINLYLGDCSQAGNGGIPYRSMSTTNHPTTGEPGWYYFENVPKGDYCISIDSKNFEQGKALVGKFASPTNATGDPNTDSNGGPTHRIFVPNLTTTDVSLDFGYYGAPNSEEGFCYVVADAGDYFALIDQTTGQLMVIGTVSPPDGENLAANPVNLELYNVSGENTATALITIDDQTGASNVLNADIGLDDVDALAFSPFTNQLYAMKANPIPGALYRVDATNGATTFMTNITIPTPDPLAGGIDPHIDGMSFHPETRELYGIYGGYGSESYLVKIDTTTGQTTFVGATGYTGVDDIEDISFAPDGTLYGVLGDQGAIGTDESGTYEGLVQINVETAEASAIGLYGTPVSGTTWDVEAFACIVPPSCGIDITNIDPGECYNSDGTSRSNITVEVTWTNAPSSENIIVSVAGQEQTIAVNAGTSASSTVQFTMPSDKAEYEVTAAFESGNCTNEATATYTAPDPCCYVEIKNIKVLPCIGDVYKAEVTVFYADHPGQGLDINGQIFQTADSTGTEQFIITDLSCGGTEQSVTATFIGEATCTDTKTIDPAGPCSITIDAVTSTPCELDKYAVEVTITFENPPGEIDINGCRFRPTGQAGTETFRVNGLDCKTASEQDLIIKFVDDNACNANDVYTAPCPQPRVCTPGAESKPD